MRLCEFGLGLGFAALATVSVQFLIPGRFLLYEAVIGFLLVSLNGLLAWLINRRTIGRDHCFFMIWNVGGHGFRAGLLLLAIAISPFYGIANMASFAIIALAGYFCFMTVEIIALNRYSRKSAP